LGAKNLAKTGFLLVASNKAYQSILPRLFAETGFVIPAKWLVANVQKELIRFADYLYSRGRIRYILQEI
jgi:hypothetical protein